jgi:glutamyl-tRNA(Gln) amidotransferase subunit E
VKAALGAGDRDAAVVAWGPRRDVDTALREVLLRATEALDGVPAETRQAFHDGTTGFERVLPGADRMYPDTDTPPFPVPDAWVEEIRTARPERPWERSDRYAAAGVPAAAAVHLAAAPWAPLFDALAPAAGAVARRVAFALERRLPRLVEPRTGAGVPDAERLAPLVRALESGDLRPEGFERALARVLAEPDLAPDAAVDAFRPRPDDESALASRVAETLAEAGQPGAPADPEATLRWAMGRTIGPLRGRVDPARARAALRAGLESPAAEGAR